MYAVAARLHARTGASISEDQTNSRSSLQGRLAVGSRWSRRTRERQVEPRAGYAAGHLARPIWFSRFCFRGSQVLKVNPFGPSTNHQELRQCLYARGGARRAPPHQLRHRCRERPVAANAERPQRRGTGEDVAGLQLVLLPDPVDLYSEPRPATYVRDPSTKRVGTERLGRLGLLNENCTGLAQIARLGPTL